MGDVFCLGSLVFVRVILLHFLLFFCFCLLFLFNLIIHVFGEVFRCWYGVRKLYYVGKIVIFIFILNFCFSIISSFILVFFIFSFPFYYLIPSSYQYLPYIYFFPTQNHQYSPDNFYFISSCSWYQLIDLPSYIFFCFLVNNE
jgi:hypothetical protein